MPKVEKQVLHHCYDQAKINYKNKDLDKARDYLDYMIAFVANKKIEGMGAKDEIEDVRIELWLERAWTKLENWNLML